MLSRLTSIGALYSVLAVLGALCAGANASGDNWPGLRGPSFDGAVHEARLYDGATAALEVGWKKTIGSGYSSVVVGDGRAITMFDADEIDVIAAFDVDSGDELWRYPISRTHAGYDGSHDGPLSTPLLAGGRVYGLGGWGHLFALDAENGQPIWTTHLVDDHGATKPYYGFTTSPILADGVLVVQIGAGEGRSIAGFDARTGEVRWALGDDEVHYQSPVLATLGGRRQVVAASEKTLWGIEPGSGKLLWSYEHEGDGSDIGGEQIIPVLAGEGRIFLTHKYDSSVMLQVTRAGGTPAGDGFEVSELWSGGTLKSSYVIPVYHDGYLYGMNGRIFTCADAATGERKWRSRDPGDGFPTVVGDRLVIITKPGTLHVAEASPEGYRELTYLDLFDEHSWSAVAYADGHLYVRSMAHIARIDPVQDAGTDAAGSSWVASTEFGRFLAELQQTSNKSALIDLFLDRQESFPIVEPSSGAVHFVYRGEADDVGIVGDMIGYRREDPMTRIAGTDFFHYSTRLEPDAAVTYGFILNYDGPVADPRNPKKGTGLFGEVSFLAMPAWQAPNFGGEAAPRPGRLEELEWESQVHEGRKRVAQVYLPAGYDDEAERRYPTLYVHGGKGALEDGDFKNALDHFTGSVMEPLIGVFVFPDEENRRADRDPDAYTTMLAGELVPRVDETYRTIRDRTARVSAGAADAGNQALYSAFKRSDLFGKVASQSPIFFDVSVFEEILGSADDQTMVVYLEWGTYHMRAPHEAWDLAEWSHAVWSMLRQRGYRPTGGEVPEGHGWVCWKGRFDEWLGALFPIP